MAADLLAEFQHVATTLLDPFTKEFVEAILLKETASDESYRRLEALSLGIIEKLRFLTKQVQSARQTRDDEAIKNAISEYDMNIEK